MSTGNSGNKTHDATVNAAEVTRQNAVVPTASRATVISAETTFYRTAAKSALANSCGVAQFLTALRELGQSLYP
jgi:hypothetical protein